MRFCGSMSGWFAGYPESHVNRSTENYISYLWSMQVDSGFQKWTKESKSCTFQFQFWSLVFPVSHLWTRPRYDNGILENEIRLVLGQEIHNARCLAVLEYFKKLMWHGNSRGFHVLFGVSWCETDRRWNFLSTSFSRTNLIHVSFETLRCLDKILHKKRRSRMSLLISCAKSELAGLPYRGLSPNSVLLCRKGVSHFFLAEIWSASSPYTVVSFIWISLAFLQSIDVGNRCSMSNSLNQGTLRKGTIFVSLTCLLAASHAANRYEQRQNICPEQNRRQKSFRDAVDQNKLQNKPRPTERSDHTLRKISHQNHRVLRDIRGL
jgi:hypothetical protein